MPCYITNKLAIWCSRMFIVFIMSSLLLWAGTRSSKNLYSSYALRVEATAAAIRLLHIHPFKHVYFWHYIHFFVKIALSLKFWNNDSMEDWFWYNIILIIYLQLYLSIFVWSSDFLSFTFMNVVILVFLGIECITRMTTSISSVAFEKKQKVKEWKIIQ